MAEVCVFSYSKILACFRVIRPGWPLLLGTVDDHYKDRLSPALPEVRRPGRHWAFVEGGSDARKAHVIEVGGGSRNRRDRYRWRSIVGSQSRR